MGVIVDKQIPNQEKVQQLLNRLNAEFERDDTTKEAIVEIMKDYLPNFDHIETGKSLDSKM